MILFKSLQKYKFLIKNKKYFQKTFNFKLDVISLQKS